MPKARRLARGPRKRIGVPVICVGTLTPSTVDLGPAVIAVIQYLQARGRRTFVISRRGHGGPDQPTEVDPVADDAATTGDTELLIAAFARVWISRDRESAARGAIAAGAEVIVMHGGFDDPVLHHDLSLLVVEAADGFGSGRMWPFGPLSEPAGAGVARADLVLAIGGQTDQKGFTDGWADAFGKPPLRAALVPLETGMDWTDTPLLAFAGIDRPDRFFSILRGLGATLARAEALEDHQALTPALMRRLEGDAAALGAQLVTTERDAVRLPRDFRQKVITLPLRLEIADPTVLEQSLDRFA